MATLVTCEKCKGASFGFNKRKTMAGKNLSTLLKNIWGDHSQAWIDGVLVDAVPPDKTFVSAHGFTGIVHPNRVMCCTGLRCRTCPACMNTCEYGCNK